MKKIDWKILWLAFKKTTIEILTILIFISFIIIPIYLATISGGNLRWLLLYLIEFYLFAIWRTYDTMLKNKDE